VENDEEGPDLEFPQFFLIMIQYMDLSTSGLQNKLLCIPLPLLIHQEYEVSNNLLNQHPKNFTGSAVISVN